MTTTSTDTLKAPKPRRSGVSGKILLIFVATALIGALVEWRRPPELVKWRDNLEAARSESNAAGKPLLLYFTADWCGPCQQMRRTTWADARVKAALDGYVPVKIDVDQFPDVAQQFDVLSIPRLVLLDRAGNAVASREGLVEPHAMIEWLNVATR
jgi:thiol:disulfide interchange protein